MNLMELYKEAPVENHHDIKVSGSRVFVRGADGLTDEYLMVDGELWLVRSDRDLANTLAAIKNKLGITG